jgi:hypothetical protein
MYLPKAPLDYNKIKHSLAFYMAQYEDSVSYDYTTVICVLKDEKYFTKLKKQSEKRESKGEELYGIKNPKRLILDFICGNYSATFSRDSGWCVDIAGENFFDKSSDLTFASPNHNTEGGLHPTKNISEYSSMLFDLHSEHLLFTLDLLKDDSKILETAKELIGMPNFLLKELFESPFEYTIYKAAIEMMEKEND